MKRVLVLLFFVLATVAGSANAGTATAITKTEAPITQQVLLTIPNRALRPTAVPPWYGSFNSTPGYTHWRYELPSVCIWDIQNSSAYDAAWSASTWQAGTATIIPKTVGPTGNCNGYLVSQRLIIRQYSAPDENCAKVTGTKTGVNGHSLYGWYWNGTDGAPSLWINTWYGFGCRETAEHRNHTMTEGMGFVFGLDPYYDTFRDCCEVMDMVAWQYDIVSGAWPVDRNRLNLLMAN